MSRAWMLAVACSLTLSCATPETPPLDEKRFRVLARGGVEWTARIAVVCDLETGNLLYIANSGTGVGIAVVPSGCGK